MTAEPVALIPQCAECRMVWLPRDDEHWSAHLTDDDSPEDRLLLPAVLGAGVWQRARRVGGGS